METANHPQTGIRVRRTQAERTAETRGALVSAARRLFAQQGYAATSVDAILAEAGVTKGALYHHFRDKKALFTEALVAVHKDVVQALRAAADAEADPWAALVAGFEAMFEVVRRADVQRIFYTDCGTVLTYAEWNAIDREFTQAEVSRLIEAATQAGELPRMPAAVLATMLSGAVDYGLDWAIEEMTPERLELVRATFFDLLQGLRVSHRHA